MKVQIGKSTILIFVIATLMQFALILNANAASNSLGVSPPSIRNTKLLPGSHFEQEIVLSRSEPTNEASANIVLEGNLVEWIKFEPSNTITMPIGEQRVYIKAIVDIPEDAPLGEYRGTAMVRLQNPGIEGQVILAPAIAIDINLNVGTEAFSILKVQTAKIPDIGEGSDIGLNIKVANEGNSPQALSKIILKFMDMNRQEIKVYETSEIQKTNAFSIEEQTVVIPDFGLKKGEYFTELEAFDANGSIYKDTLVFNVTDPVAAPTPKSIINLDSLPVTGRALVSTCFISAGLAIILFVIVFFLVKRPKKKKNKVKN